MILEDIEELGQEVVVMLNVLDDVDLVEEYERIEDAEGWIVEDSCQYDIFQVEQPIGLVNLGASDSVPDLDHLAEPRWIGHVIAVGGFQIREFRVVCGEGWYCVSDRLYERAPRLLTF